MGFGMGMKLVNPHVWFAQNGMLNSCLVSGNIKKNGMKIPEFPLVLFSIKPINHTRRPKSRPFRPAHPEIRPGKC